MELLVTVGTEDVADISVRLGEQKTLSYLEYV